MTSNGVSRRQLLAAVGLAGTLAGCADVLNEGGNATTTDGTAQSTTTATSATTGGTETQTETQTQDSEPAFEVTDASLREDVLSVGDRVEVVVSVANTGDAAGTTELSLAVGGETVRTERVEVSAGEEVQRVLDGGPVDETGTVPVAVNGRNVGEVTVEASSVIHVAPDGSDDDPGTEDAPLATISTAVDRAGPGDTVEVHPGEYVDYVEFQDGGEPDAPITLTGPPDAVLKPLREPDHQAISVGASYVHITGLTITGLYDPDNPEDPASYNAGKLIDLNTFADGPEDFIEGLVVSPHRIGNAGQALINSQMIKDCEIGGFEVIGPAGTEWILDDSHGHNGEIVYLGTAADNRVEYGYEEYDRTRNVRVHHIDNSAGHPHSELVDCKCGVENVTVEYCTDAGGVQTHEGPYSRGVSLDGRGCTVRWNVIQNAEGDAVRVGPQSFMSDPGRLGEPQTDLERGMGKDHAVYGNVFTGNSHEAINFLRESQHPGRDSNPQPADQRALCGNRYDGYSDTAATESCPADVPAGDGVGHLGGDSPWDGDAPTRDEVFERNGNALHLNVTVDGGTVPTDSPIEVPIAVTNTGDSREEVVFRLRVHEYELDEASVTVPAGEQREVTLTDGGLPDEVEISVTRNGQKVGRVQVTDDA